MYLGEHIHLGTKAAIKVLHTQLTGDDTEQFRTEARTIAHLEHPHIVRILDFGVEGKTPFLVMSFAPNGTLRQRHPKGERLPLATIVSYVQQVADALQYAHEEKLIHRDIKPENMLLGRRHEVLLSDFGIATVAQSSRYQSTQDVIGTVAYMAPEQIQGKPRPASDQYSLGIVVYEWVCGDRPFHGSFTELCAQHMFAPLPPLREKVSAVPLEVEQVVQTALAKDPKERFQTIQAFATALKQAFQSAQSDLPMKASMPIQPSPSVQATPPSASQSLPPTVKTPSLPPNQPLLPTQLASPPGQSPNASDEVPSSLAAWFNEASQSKPQPSRHSISRRTVVIGLVGLTAVVAVGGGLSWLIHSTPTAVGTLFYTYRSPALQVNSIAWSPDNKRVAASLDNMGRVWDALTGKNVLTHNGATTVAWSPDGKRIASASDDKTVQIWDATTGSTIFAYSGHLFGAKAVAWSPKGQFIASGGNYGDNTVQIWDATTGRGVFTYRGHSGGINGVNGEIEALVWSPDEQLIASAGNDETVQVWHPTTGDTVFTYHHSVNALAWSPDGKRIASASDDKTVQIWDATTGGNVFSYRGHSGIVGSCDMVT